MLIKNKLTLSYVTYYTIQSLIGFCSLKIKLKDEDKSIDELYFIQTETTLGWIGDNEDPEYIKESLCDYRIRFTPAVETKILSVLPYKQETRPNGETWKDNSKYKFGRPEFKYFTIGQLEEAITGCYFQEYQCDEAIAEDSLYKTGKTLSAFFQEDLSNDEITKKHFYIKMSNEEIKMNDLEEERLLLENSFEQIENRRMLKESNDDWMDGDESNYWNID